MVLSVVMMAGVTMDVAAQEQPVVPAVTQGKMKAVKVKMSALHRAAFYNDVKAIEALIDGGANPNERASRNVTALHMAAHEGNVEAAKILVKKGVNPDLTNAQKETALDVAIRKGRADMVDYLFTVTHTAKKNLGFTPMKETTPPAVEEKE